jgi:hypothetical protein
MIPAARHGTKEAFPALDLLLREPRAASKQSRNDRGDTSASLLDRF